MSEDSDVESGDEHDDSIVSVWFAEPDVLQASAVAEGHFAVAVDLVVAHADTGADVDS